MKTPCFLLLLAASLATTACGDDDGVTPRSDAGARDAGGTDARVMTADTGPDADDCIMCTSEADCPPMMACVAGFCGDAQPPVCTIAECSDGLASTCEGDLALSCGSFGASCDSFVDPDGAVFDWCDCGSLSAGEIRCNDARTLVECVDGVFAQPGLCAEGAVCRDASDGVDPGCYCDNFEDGICPDPGCTDDPDCGGCTPNCDGRSCGDNGCGGSCGSCSLGNSCNAGVCEANCTPSCGSRVCGSNGCGGSCGTCGSGESCTDAGECVSDCTPSCGSNVCGSNGCGGFCGTCASGESCESGQCVADATCGSGGACTSPAVCAGVSSGGERCACIGETQTYTFDGSALDFTGALRSAEVEVRQLFANDTSPTRWRDSSNFRTSPNASMDFRNGCGADIEVVRIFRFVIDGRTQTCRIGPERYTDQNSFTIPMPSGEGSDCSSPRL